MYSTGFSLKRGALDLDSTLWFDCENIWCILLRKKFLHAHPLIYNDTICTHSHIMFMLIASTKNCSTALDKPPKRIILLITRRCRVVGIWRRSRAQHDIARWHRRVVIMLLCATQNADRLNTQTHVVWTLACVASGRLCSASSSCACRACKSWSTCRMRIRIVMHAVIRSMINRSSGQKAGIKTTTSLCLYCFIPKKRGHTENSCIHSMNMCYCVSMRLGWAKPYDLVRVSSACECAGVYVCNYKVIYWACTHKFDDAPVYEMERRCRSTLRSSSVYIMYYYSKGLSCHATLALSHPIR